MKYIVSLMTFVCDIFHIMDEKKDLIDFFIDTMKEKGLSPTDITKRSGLSASQVSKILNRESPAGEKALTAFSIALNIPVEVIYRYAGKLPTTSKKDTHISEIETIYENLSEPRKNELLQFARFQLSLQERNDKNKRPPSRPTKTQ